MNETAESGQAAAPVMSKGHLMLLTIMLGMIAMLGPVSVDTFLASIPKVAEGLNTTPAGVAFSLSMLLLGNAIGQLIHGPLADRYGRKPVIVGMLLVYSAAAFAAVLATAIEALIAARFVQGLAQAGGRILGGAVARDLFEREHLAKMMSRIMLAMSVGTLVGPGVGGLLAQYLPWWQSCFVFMAGFGLVTLVMILLLYRETAPRKDYMALDPGMLAANFRNVAVNPVFLRHAACSGFTMAGFGPFLAISSPLLIGVYGLEPATFGYLFMLVSGCFLLGNVLAGFMVPRIGATNQIGIGVAFLVASGATMLGLALAGVASAYAVVLPMCIYMFGIAQVFPQTSAGALQPFGATAGVASSLLGFFQNTSAAIVMIALGFLPVVSALPMATAMTITSVSAAAMYLFAIRPAEARTHPEAANSPPS